MIHTKQHIERRFVLRCAQEKLMLFPVWANLMSIFYSSLERSFLKIIFRDPIHEIPVTGVCKTIAIDFRNTLDKDPPLAGEQPKNNIAY